jgi:flagellar hook assembly protein FlgD
MKIIDQGNRVVKEIVNSKYNSKNIVYCEYWDGLNSKGELVANGMYYILLELSDGSKDIYPVFVRK